MKNLFFLVLLLSFYSCSTITVTYDYDKEVDFTTYKTFSLMSWRDDNSQLINDFDKKRLEDAIKVEMGSRGYSYTETGGDLAVSTYLILEDKTDYTAYNDYYGGFGYGGYGGYGGPWGYGYGGGTTVSKYEYTQGTLIFNVFDAKEKKLVWQGIAIGEVDQNPKNRDRGIPKVVAEVFLRYPIAKLVEKK